MKYFHDYNRVAVMSPTGSGKTTMVPQWILDDLFPSNDDNQNNNSNGGFGSIICAQPTRVGAINLAIQVAKLRKEKLGDNIAYCMRLNATRDANKAKLVFTTHGTLHTYLRMNNLDDSNNAVIIVDEVHSNSLDCEILMPQLKELLARPNNAIKVILMSATMNLNLLYDYFGRMPVVEPDGVVYPVETYYLNSSDERDYVDNAVRAIVHHHLYNGVGDILVFLPGIRDIKEVDKRLKLLTDIIPENTLITKILHAKYPTMDTINVNLTGAKHSNTRIVYLVTNVAETSITVDNLTAVVDSGWCKIKVNDCENGIDSIIYAPISKASANQRRGRAGRTQTGICYRLYSENEYENMPEQLPPEILRINLGPTILQLFCMGITNPYKYNFFTRPSSTNIASAINYLVQLKFLDPDTNQVTESGRIAARLPLTLGMSRVLLSSLSDSCLYDLIKIAAMLSIKDNIDEFFFEKTHIASFVDPTSDHITLLNIYNRVMQGQTTLARKNYCSEMKIRYQSMINATKEYQKIVNILKNHNLIKCTINDDNYEFHSSNTQKIKESLYTGLFLQTAQSVVTDYYVNWRLPNDQLALVDRSSHVRTKNCHDTLAMYDHVVKTNHVYLHNVTLIDTSVIPQTVNNEIHLEQVSLQPQTSRGPPPPPLSRITLETHKCIMRGINDDDNVEMRKRQYIADTYWSPSEVDKDQLLDLTKDMQNLIIMKKETSPLDSCEKCAYLKKHESCDFGKYCAFTHGCNYKLDQNRDVWFKSSNQNDDEDVMIIYDESNVSLVHNNSNIKWIVQSLEQNQLYTRTRPLTPRQMSLGFNNYKGPHVFMVRVLDNGNFAANLQKFTHTSAERRKIEKIALEKKRQKNNAYTSLRRKRIRMPSINQSTEDKSHVCDVAPVPPPSATDTFMCPTCPVSFVWDNTLDDWISHFRLVHDVPLLYYNEPLIIRFRPNDENNDNNVVYCCFIQYLYMQNQYLLFVVTIDEEGTLEPVMYHVNNTESRVKIDWNFNTTNILIDKDTQRFIIKDYDESKWTETLPIIHFFYNSVKSLWPIATSNKNEKNHNTYILVVSDRRNEVSIVKSPLGCYLCGGGHSVASCSHISFFDSVVDKLEERKQHNYEIGRVIGIVLKEEREKQQSQFLKANNSDKFVSVMAILEPSTTVKFSNINGRKIDEHLLQLQNDLYYCSNVLDIVAQHCNCDIPEVREYQLSDICGPPILQKKQTSHEEATQCSGSRRTMSPDLSFQRKCQRNARQSMPTDEIDVIEIS